jgi:cellulose synthase/poly-beta-1,6-N-acetylglucosamine synthase-like glycosyltransferase
VLAPFEDDGVGGEGTCKRVQRVKQGFTPADFLNCIACLYLERHKFGIVATNSIDGGVFVISGRTAVYRTDSLNTEEFMQGFVNEYCLFNLVGPLNADDDNYITRYLVQHRFKVKVQASDSVRIETTLGVGGYGKFLRQCLRWARTNMEE